MTNQKYHVSQNSIYLQVNKVLFEGDGFKKLRVSYHSKSSGAFITEESIKVPSSVIAFWEKWTK